MTHAIILRCPPAKTREIFDAFKEERPGLIWAPMISRTRRLPRQRKKVTVVTAAIPGYLFMAEAKGPLARPLDELARKQCKPLWSSSGFFVRCPMVELYRLHEAVAGLCQTLTAAEKPPETPIFAPGTTVAVDAGHYWLAGMRGQVITQQDEEVTLNMADFWGTLKISCWLLRPASL